MGTTARAEQVRTVIADVVATLDLIVEDVAVTPAGKRRLVRVLVDRDVRALTTGADLTSEVAPLSLDEVAEATRAVSDALDATDAMGEQPYVLEVSSPGIDRPLEQPWHFRRNVGRLVELTLAEGEPITGRIESADESGVTVADPAGDQATGQPVPYGDVRRARVQVEFNRAADAGAKEEEG